MCQNEQLNQLELYERSAPSNVMESTQLLVNEGALLAALGAWLGDREDDQLVDFVGVLGCNRSLKKLSVGNAPDDAPFSPIVMEEVAQVLEASASFQPLRLELRKADCSSDATARAATAAKEHVPSQKFVLRRFKEASQSAA